MGEKVINTRIKHKFDTEANWRSNDPVLLAGELAFSSDTVGKYKIGNGGSKWSELPYAFSNELAKIGTIGDGKIVGTSPINASISNGVATISHVNSGITAGTYRSVTVNEKGHVTAGSNPTTLSGYGITDAASKNHTHSYLPLSGGNMVGTAFINWTDTGNWSNNNSGVTFPVRCGGLSWSGQSDGIQLYAEETGNDNLELVLKFTDDNSNGLSIRNKDGNQTARISSSGLFTGSFQGNISGNASTATKATQDSAGQQINTTYIKGLSVSGRTITYTKGDGSTGTITTQDTNTTYSTGTASASGLTKLYTGTGTGTDGTMTQKAITDALGGKAASSHTHNYAGSSSAGGSANSAVKLDTATAGSTTQPVYFTGGKPIAIGYTIAKSVPANAVFTDHTYGNMKGASSSAAGSAGLVPAPATGQQGLYLRGDGTWATPSNTTYTVGTTSYSGTTKLYTGTGTATDGTMTQAAIKSALDGKANSSHTHSYAGASSAGGSANSANKLSTARSIGLSGDASGSVNFDGSGNVSIPATIRKYCFVGSDVENSAGWYKVASQTLSGYGDTNVIFVVTSTYANYYTGVFALQIRSDNTSIQCPTSKWLVRSGFAADAIRIVISGMSWTMYVNQTNGQYGRIMFEIVSQSSINSKDSGITLFNSSTKESAAPTATKTSTDGGSVSWAATAGSATKDSANQQINTTYVKGLSVSGQTITITKGDNTTSTIKTQDTNTTYGTGNASTAGITKLYTGTGSATDGTMTQNAITTALNGKSATGHTHNYAGSSSVGGNANAAVKLATARKIGSASFDGTADITLSQMGVINPIELTRAEYEDLIVNNRIDDNQYYNVIDDYDSDILINDSSVSKKYVYSSDKTEKTYSKRSTTSTVTLSASTWSGSSAPYSYVLSVEGVTATNIIEINYASSASDAAIEAYQGAGLKDGGQSNGRITLLATEKPTVNIPITIIIRNDL